MQQTSAGKCLQLSINLTALSRHVREVLVPNNTKPALHCTVCCQEQQILKLQACILSMSAGEGSKKMIRIKKKLEPEDQKKNK